MRLDIMRIERRRVLRLVVSAIRVRALQIGDVVVVLDVVLETGLGTKPLATVSALVRIDLTSFIGGVGVAHMHRHS
jgi:hypothetical protein